MDDLIMCRVGRVWAVPLVVAAAISCALAGHSTIGIAGDVSSAEGKAYSGRHPTRQDLAWIIHADAEIRQIVQSDTIPRAEVLQRVRDMWQSGFAGRPADSVPAPASLLEELTNMQIDHISSLLGGSEKPGLSSDTDRDVNLGQAARAVNRLATLIPLVRAARDSLRSSLLVVSSVGCKCELERCATMAGLYASLRGDTLIGPMAMVDVMESSPLEVLLGSVDIPYWILFTEDGQPGTLVEGDSYPEDVTASVASWFGVTKSTQTKPDRPNPPR